MMMKHARLLGMVTVGLAVAACGSGGDEGEHDAFVVPGNAVPIGSSGLYVAAAEPATAPHPTGGSLAPRIMALNAMRTGDYSFEVHIDVDSTAPIADAYLDFGADGVYRARATPVIVGPSAGDPPLTACGYAASQQGITCTTACLAACSCLSCADKNVELQTEQACALTCSIQDGVGVLDSEPYNGSETNFASMLYDGWAELGIPGIASQLGCGTGACTAPSSGTRRKAWSITFESPTVPEVTPLFAPQVTTEASVPAVSEPFAAAQVKICPPGIMACR